MSLLCLALVGACQGDQGPQLAEQRPASCPESRRVSPPLPNVFAEHETLAYWLSRNEGHGSLDDLLLDPGEVRRHNLALQATAGSEVPRGQADLLAPVDRHALRSHVEGRLAHLRSKLAANALVDQHAAPIPSGAAQMFDASKAMVELSEWRAVERPTALRCGPYEHGLYQSPVDVDFDRNRCSTIRRGEVVQLLALWANGMYLARTAYALGWVQEAALSAPMDVEAAKKAIGPRETLPFTRRTVLSEAFAMLGAPYGWGGKDEGYDCSRFLLDLFSRFGIKLPRNSAQQALAGTFSLDVSEVDELNEKLLLIEAAARRGLALLHFPGHIMLYLGTTTEGTPMAIHAFSEFLTPCEGTDAETVNRVDRIAVSDLSLGAGTSRRDFLSRITRITVFGGTPGYALAADAELRPAAPITLPEERCSDSSRAAIFQLPRNPSASVPLRVLVTSERDPGPASLVLYDPDGVLVEPSTRVLDGPPYGRWVEVPPPKVGRWTAVFADGDETVACQRIVVAAHPRPPALRETPGPAWAIEKQWEPDVENLYSAFVEQLFRSPEEDDVTWPSLQALIADPERNLLYGYRAPDEDAQLALEPDCADLPYFLRAYFAWKLRLPFGYRACTRGGSAEPPRCDPIDSSNLDPVPGGDDASAFARFVRRLAGTVHSSSPRTLPSDDETDFYPVRLSRRAIRPGTVFADPYGHVLVVARWKPQRIDDYGVLIGADAQPDGTVGRRRFWRGSFLFTPQTDIVGAGFKAWRPVFDAVEGSESRWHAPRNAGLRSRGPMAWSDQQYRVGADEFYSAMDGLINPRPLDPIRRQASLVDALDESVHRRLSSVQNGEDFMRSRSYSPIDMPRGRALFLTTGPWEDYSTPSRDMRLLISIDAVLSFADEVEAHPERFGVSERDRDTAARLVRETLAQDLQRRRFEYERSDGSTWTLSLEDLVNRVEALEAAYNPNDCVEIRWGAPEGSEERSTCSRTASEEQRKRMQSYRRWFGTRQRPG